MGVRWFAAMLAGALCWGTACGDGEPPLFDPMTFSGMNEGSIRHDCKESLQCLAQMGMELPDDPMGRCVEDSAKVLESSAEKRANFLRKYGRCMNYVVCDYYTCARSNVSGYGDTQRDKVMHDCQASIDCKVMQGAFTGDMATALEGCVASWMGTLDGYTMTQRQQYESVYASCMSFTGCQFASCFNNGMGMGMTTMP